MMGPVIPTLQLDKSWGGLGDMMCTEDLSHSKHPALDVVMMKPCGCGGCGDDEAMWSSNSLKNLIEYKHQQRNKT